MAGSVIGTKLIDQNEANVGESRNGDRILREAGFTVDKKGENVEAQSQMVLIQSTTLTVKDPAFQAALADTEKTLRSFPQVHSLHSPLTPRYTELTSKDGHSAIVQFIRYRRPEATVQEMIEKEREAQERSPRSDPKEDA